MAMFKDFMDRHLLGSLAKAKIKSLQQEGCTKVFAENIVRQELNKIATGSKNDTLALNKWQRRACTEANFKLNPKMARELIRFFNLQDISDREFIRLCRFSTLTLIKQDCLNEISELSLYKKSAYLF